MNAINIADNEKDNFKSYLKTIVKQIPNIQSLISSKSALYFGLATYWAVILFGTFLNI